MATAAKPRSKKPKMIEGGGPFKRETADDPIKADFEDKAKKYIRAVLKAQGSDYAKLQAGLAELGVVITPAALENKIARGSFSAAFLFQCLTALGAEHPKP